jgi:nicotinate-nucleotide adenylyltransferase
MKRIGLLGGSFNPAHGGHRRISLAAMKALGLDEVWWLVSPGNPLKDGAKDMARYSDRFTSAKAMARQSRIRVSDFERRAGTRYTVDTVRALQERYPRTRFIWLMGGDTVAQFHQWKHWRKLAESLPIAVIRRPGYDRQAHAARAMGWLRRFVRPSSQAKKWTDWSAPAILFLRLPPDPTSATGLRAHDPNWHERFRDPEPGPKRFALPTSVRRALARSSH